MPMQASFVSCGFSGNICAFGGAAFLEFKFSGNNPGEPVKLFLAFGAVEARPAALHDAFDGAAAILAGAGLAFAVVDREAVLEFAERALV
jgi:hypothetical protein